MINEGFQWDWNGFCCLLTSRDGFPTRFIGVRRGQDRGTTVEKSGKKTKKKKMSMRLSAAALVAACVMAAGQAGALTTFPDYAGPNFTYTQLQEASSSGDPEPLFGAPTGSADQLLFFPTTFQAGAAFGDFDHTGSQFQARVTGNTAVDTITTVDITEFGDAELDGAGSAATYTWATMAGFVTVLADTSGPISPVVIPFSATFLPSDFLYLTTNPGITAWSASVSVDVASHVAGATEVQISLDNDLYAFSEGETSASLQKQGPGGGPAVIIGVIPEPGTALLVGSGLLVMGLRGRRSRD